MRLAIDAGNSHVCFGIYNFGKWEAVFRTKTDRDKTEDQIGAEFFGMYFHRFHTRPIFEDVSIASVVPSLDRALESFSQNWLLCKPYFLQPEQNLGIEILYETPSAVGADRIANALAALQIKKPPLVIVDFGTATTFDAIDKEGRYLGGAILPGPRVAAASLFERTSKLPHISLSAPEQAIGRNTPDAIRSGLVLGYAHGIDGLATQISFELGGAEVLVTGGLGSLFKEVCQALGDYLPNLTLHGILIAHDRAVRSD